MNEDDGVPLAHYIENHPDAGVQFNCQACAAHRNYPIPDVVAWLRRAGLGDEQTGVRALARLRRRPCACGAVRWESRPAFRMDKSGS